MARRFRKQKKDWVDKLHDKYPGFLDEVLGLSIDELEKKIFAYAKELESSEQHLKENEDVKRLQEQLKEAKASYNEVKKAIKLKTKYCFKLIREKGGNV
jgi:DNA repair exonuclease SbcCD ATPase subunit